MKGKSREKNADTPCSIDLSTVTVCFVYQIFLSISFFNFIITIH
ncbi:putative membrane protein [Bacteroides fragilis str. DS-71]|nr:putative membrane protein [Bacteroides fragilis str. DS-71]